MAIAASKLSFAKRFKTGIAILPVICCRFCNAKLVAGPRRAFSSRSDISPYGIQLNVSTARQKVSQIEQRWICNSSPIGYRYVPPAYFDSESCELPGLSSVVLDLTPRHQVQAKDEHDWSSGNRHKCARRRPASARAGLRDSIQNQQRQRKQPADCGPAVRHVRVVGQYNASCSGHAFTYVLVMMRRA